MKIVFQCWKINNRIFSFEYGFENSLHMLAAGARCSFGLSHRILWKTILLVFTEWRQILWFGRTTLQNVARYCGLCGMSRFCFSLSGTHDWINSIEMNHRWNNRTRLKINASSTQQALPMICLIFVSISLWAWRNRTNISFLFSHNL